MNWLKNFLSDRLQIVSNQNELSKPDSINQGVPQGTVIGPPSFNMSFDDLKCLYEKACLVKFADDNNPVIGVRGLDDPRQIIIEGIFKWCMDHNFIVNTLKSKEMRFNFKKKVPFICSDIESIPLVQNMKVLGIIIDSRFNFLPHKSKATSRTSSNRFLFLLLKLKRLDVQMTFLCYISHFLYQP